MSARARHCCVVAIFLFFGVAALIPTVYFTQRAAAAADFQDHRSFSKYFLTSPSTFFAPAIALAGLRVWKLGLLARGIHASAPRIVGGTALGFFVYPLVYLFVVFTTFAAGSVLMSLALSTGYRHTPPGPHPELGILLALPLPATIYLALALAIVHAALALGIVTRCWPRRVALWAFLGSAAMILCNVSVVFIREMMRSRVTRSWHSIVNSAPEFPWGAAWDVPLVIIIGVPILAAIVGHWLYLAAEEYAKAPT